MPGKDTITFAVVGNLLTTLVSPRLSKDSCSILLNTQYKANTNMTTFPFKGYTLWNWVFVRSSIVGCHFLPHNQWYVYHVGGKLILDFTTDSTTDYEGGNGSHLLRNGRRPNSRVYVPFFKMLQCCSWFCTVCLRVWNRCLDSPTETDVVRSTRWRWFLVHSPIGGVHFLSNDQWHRLLKFEKRFPPSCYTKPHQ